MIVKKLILVVDDEDPLRRLIGRTLEMEGYEAVLAPGGEEALSMVDQLEPDLAILDIMMPGVNGFQVLASIREHSDMPVIMLSGLVELTTVYDALTSGADDFLRKPFHIRELVERVKVKLNRAEKEKSETSGGNPTERSNAIAR